MLAVAKKPRIEVRAKKIPQTLIDFLNENFGGVEIEKEHYSPEEIPELVEAREKTSPAEAIFINRDMRGWTQTDLAEKLEVSVQVVCDLENSRRAVSRKMAVKLGEVFGTDPSQFFKFT